MLNDDAVKYAGMRTDSASLGRPDSHGSWQVPLDVKLDDDALRSLPGGEPVSDRRELLEAFVRLIDQPDRAFVAFARKWGIINICGHGVPASHFPERYNEWTEDDHGPGCGRLNRGLDGWHREKLSYWRDYAEQAATILNIAAQLNARHPTAARADIWGPLADLVRPTNGRR